MKKALIITAFDNYVYPIRTKYLEAYLADRGYQVTVLASDFDHRLKQTYQVQRDGLELVPVPRYQKNLSFARIKSHYVFAKRVRARAQELSPDLVCVIAPPNFLVRFFAAFKEANPQTKVFTEIGDLWPETLPAGSKMKKILAPVLSIWSRLRDKHLKAMDYVIYECDLFSQQVAKHHPLVPYETIYLCREDYDPQMDVCLNQSETLKIAYLGSINHIIDIDLIVSFLAELGQHKPLSLELIGGGENKALLLEKCQQRGIPVNDHGMIYQDDRKYDILKSCHFGLNIMKDSVVVGATMKSLEYFHWGLAIINTIKGDTEELVERYQSGFELSADNCQDLAIQLAKLPLETINTMRQNARQTYHEQFDEKIMKQRYAAFLDRLLTKERTSEN